MSNQITAEVSFCNSSILTINQDNIIFVAMKPIVNNIGIDWSGQLAKLRNQKDKFNCRYISIVARDGKIRKVLCIPLKKLNGWLFNINPERVKSDIKPKLIQYQEECFQVLHEYWATGEVKKKTKTTVDERTPLRDAVNMLVGKKGVAYSEAYSYIHQRFNVSSIEELRAELLPEAIEYVHRLAVEKESAQFTRVNVLLSSPGRWLVTLLPSYEPQIINAANYNLIDADTCDKLSNDIAYFSKEFIKYNKLVQLSQNISQRLRVIQGEENRGILDQPLKQLS